jgi:pimeloyl-ACP methyl ester carboxylesterase
MDGFTASADQVVYFDGGEGPLLGILTAAPDPVEGVVVCAGGWHGGSINANRMIVRFARGLAAGGRNVVRFDWHGAGESPGHIRFFRLDDPGSGDAVGAAALARSAADLPISLVGICIGTRAVLAAAPHIPSLERVVLVNFPLPTARAKAKRAGRIGAATAVREGIRPSAIQGWFQPATRRVYIKFLRLKWQAAKNAVLPKKTSEADGEVQRRAAASASDVDALVAQIAELIDRGVQVLFLFGADDATYEQFVAAREGPLGAVLESEAADVTVETVAGDLTGYSSLESQAAFLDIVTDWLERPVRQP